MWAVLDIVVRLAMIVLWIGGGAFVIAYALDRADLARERRAMARRRERMARDAARVERIGL